MNSNQEILIFLSYAIGILLVYVFSTIIFKPLNVLKNVIINSVAGTISIFVINLLGSFWNFFVPLNYLNALIVGFLGIPGVLLTFVM